MNTNYSKNLNHQQKSRGLGKGMPKNPEKGKEQDNRRAINPSQNGNASGKNEKWSK